MKERKSKLSPNELFISFLNRTINNEENDFENAGIIVTDGKSVWIKSKQRCSEIARWNSDILEIIWNPYLLSSYGGYDRSKSIRCIQLHTFAADNNIRILYIKNMRSERL